jgi:dihydroorotate dehydrogenase
MSFAVRPLLFALPPERAHALTVAGLALLARLRASGMPGAGSPVSSARLRTRVAGIDFPNPLGLAAGADKDARGGTGWHALGFGAAEFGTMTPLPQPGNPRPRVFRLKEDRALVNRLGFNNEGQAAGIARVAAARAGPSGGRFGINVGANKDAADRLADYAAGVAAAAPHADWVTVNVSSPNTPGLRDLQHGSLLNELLAACDEGRLLPGGGRVPLFLKVAPDLDGPAVEAIARAAGENGVDALVVGNTTVTRPALRSAAAAEGGGLSGAPLAPLALARLRDFRRATGGAVPLVAAGGIGSGADAYARVRAGASLVQVYTALVYEGPGLARRMLRELDALLARDGFANVSDAVGADAA